MNQASVILVFLSCMISLGCSSARIISQNIDGGVLSLHGSESGMLAEAQKAMQAHCGSRGFSIIKRETVVVGQEQYTQTNYQDQSKTNAQTDEEQVTETVAERVKDPSVESSAEQSNSAQQSQTETKSVAQGEETTVSGVRQITEHHLTYRCGQ